MRVVKVTYNVIPVHDVLLPPLSSKVIKYLILDGKILPFLKDLVTSRTKNKPLFISNLEFGGRRLFSTGKPLRVKAGSIMRGKVSFPFTEEVLGERGGSFRTPYGEFQVSVEVLSVFDGSDVQVEGRNFLLEFLTPTLLASKIYLPPSLHERYGKIDSGYALLPTPGLVIAAAYRQYAGLLGTTANQEADQKAFKLLVLGNSLSRVVGFNLRPITAVLGEEEGRLRKTRGVVGWIEFDVLGPMKRRAAKYLAYSNYFGLGRGGGVGLGEVQFRVVERSKGGGGEGELRT